MSAERYRLQAYICADGCVRHMPHDGWMEFDQLYMANPDGCRFCVAEAQDGVYLFDMWEAIVFPQGCGVSPNEWKVFATVDAAIAAAVLLY